MNRPRCCIAFLFLIISAAVPAYLAGDDLLPPAWRGEPGTTFQQWTFDDDDNPAVPELIDNPYGSALAEITVWGFGWCGLYSRQGLWTDFDLIHLTVDDTFGDVGSKLVLVQVTYFSDGGIVKPPLVSVDNGAFVSETAVDLESYGTGRWYLRQEVWSISPFFNVDVIDITPSTSPTAVVDQVVVDTIYIGPPRIISTEYNSGIVTVTWESNSASTYRVESSESSSGYQGSSTVWTTEASGIAGNPGSTQWIDATPPSEVSKFYRVVLED